MYASIKVVPSDGVTEVSPPTNFPNWGSPTQLGRTRDLVDLNIHFKMLSNSTGDVGKYHVIVTIGSHIVVKYLRDMPFTRMQRCDHQLMLAI